VKQERELVMFAKNMGSTDRIVRILVGLALLLWFFLDNGGGFWHYAKLIGIVPLVTAIFNTCPLYSVLGMNTKKV
jgi:hypothetical protein